MNRKHHFSLKWTKPKPLVERRNCLGVAERLDFHGRTSHPAHRRGAGGSGRARSRRGWRTIPRADMAIAVCLLFSYVNPAHELRLREFLQSGSRAFRSRSRTRLRRSGASTSGAAPLSPTATSSRSCSATSRRRSTRSPQGGLGVALVADEVERGQDPSRRGRGRADQVPPLRIGRRDHRRAVLRATGRERGNLVTLDMGGTSCDVGLIRDGKIAHSTNFEIEFGLPVATPTIDLTTIGAGGGSIAWIDKGGLLRVGPQSAGADPGPVCYDTGGEEVTVTDANLALGPAQRGILPWRHDPAQHAEGGGEARRAWRPLRSGPPRDGAGGRRYRQREHGQRHPRALDRPRSRSRASTRLSPSAAPGRSTPRTSPPRWG